MLLIGLATGVRPSGHAKALFPPQFEHIRVDTALRSLLFIAASGTELPSLLVAKLSSCYSSGCN
jgi:hypothetical protein